MLKNDTLKNGTSLISLYGSAPPPGEHRYFCASKGKLGSGASRLAQENGFFRTKNGEGSLKTTSHLTTFMRGMCTKGRIQRRE